MAAQRGEVIWTFGFNYTRRTCPECKKAFDATDDWGYRIGSTLYCTYSCMRAVEKRMKAAEMEREQKKMARFTADYYPEIRRRLDAGQTYKDIASAFKASPAEVASFIKKMADLAPMLEAEAPKSEAPKPSPEAPKPKAAPETPKAKAPEKPPKASPVAAWKALGMVEMALTMGSFSDDAAEALRSALHDIETALACA